MAAELYIFNALNSATLRYIAKDWQGNWMVPYYLPRTNLLPSNPRSNSRPRGFNADATKWGSAG